MSGSIAKIIFSSATVDEDYVFERSDHESIVARATVHVLEVKPAYRGFDLGGLLFWEAMQILRRRYVQQEEALFGQQHNTKSGSQSSIIPTILCQLDAEEETGRHNKLVQFYETLGCSLKPDAKTQYLYHANGETLRKLPMQARLRSVSMKDSYLQQRQDADPLFLSSQVSFIPIMLLDTRGQHIRRLHSHVSLSSKTFWLLVDDGHGQVLFRTTRGQYLYVTSEGQCRVMYSSQLDDSVHKLWSRFRLVSFEDTCDRRSDDNGEEKDENQKLWTFKSTHGTYLGCAPGSNSLFCFELPVFWQAKDGQDFSLMCTWETTRQGHHNQQSWQQQTHAFVTKMRERYLPFSLARMDIQTCLYRAKSLAAFSYALDEDLIRRISLRTLCFRSAEEFRRAGYPDWVQFVALIHGLGQLVRLLDVEATSAAVDGIDWTIPTPKSKVVGCSVPTSKNCSEVKACITDICKGSHNSSSGVYDNHCGLDNVMLSWTGSEYVYEMLRHNGVLLPEEGLRMIRYASLQDWHTFGCYSSLTNDADTENQQSIAEYAGILDASVFKCRVAREMTDQECDELWESHYYAIATKYELDGELSW
jgi:inositol oxygenase